jgi:hypothetical protein
MCVCVRQRDLIASKDSLKAYKLSKDEPPDVRPRQYLVMCLLQMTAESRAISAPVSMYVCARSV